MKKKIIVSSIILCCILSITFCVKAATPSFKFVPEANNTSLKEGQTVVITLKLQNIDMGEEGVNTFGGKLVYDANIFEEVTASSFSSQNNWSIAYNSENTDKKGTFLASILSGGVKDNQTIGTLTLKVKTNLKSTQTNVQFTNLESAADTTVSTENKTVTLKIEGTKQEESDNNQNTQNGNKVEGNTNKTTENKVNNEKDNTTTNKKLPQTGSYSISIIIAIIVIIGIAIVSYHHYKKTIG